MNYNITSYGETEVTKESGARLKLFYAVVDEKEDDLTNYGVYISTSEGFTRAVRGITTSKEVIEKLIAMLIRHTVTPATLSDVISDIFSG